MTWMVKDKVLDDYLQACIEASETFFLFKRDQRLTKIWEHASKRTGEYWLEKIKKDNPWLFNIARIFDNDHIGNPERHDYDGLIVSANTLQYIGVLSNLITRFGTLNNKRIVEIGGGYGGQALVIKTVFRKCEYSIIDLPEVRKLQNEYLQRHKVFIAEPGEAFGLCISNYALSEIKDPLQSEYIEKYCRTSEHGYITANIEIPGIDWGKREPDIPTERETNFIITW